MKEQMHCCWFELVQHQHTCAVGLLWATAAGFSNAICDGEKFHKIDCIHVVFFWLWGELSPRFGPHTKFGACCPNISLGNVRLFPFLSSEERG